MKDYHGPRTAPAAEASELDLPEEVRLEIAGLAGKLREACSRCRSGSD